MLKPLRLRCNSANTVVEACPRFAGATASLARAPSRGAHFSSTRPDSTEGKCHDLFRFAGDLRGRLHPPGERITQWSSSVRGGMAFP
jgi:hypothetical protein